MPTDAQLHPRSADDAAALLRRAGQTRDPVDRGVLLLRARAADRDATSTPARALLEHAQDGAGGVFMALLLERLDAAFLVTPEPGARAAARTYARFLAARCRDPHDRAALEAVRDAQLDHPDLHDFRRIAEGAPFDGAVTIALRRAEESNDDTFSASWAARALLLALREPACLDDDAVRARLVAQARRGDAQAVVRYVAEYTEPARPVSVPAAVPPRRPAPTQPIRALGAPPTDAADPETQGLLRLADAAIAAREWDDAVELLERGARRLRDPAERARRYFELGAIEADRLHNTAHALEHFLVSFICAPAADTLARLETLYRSAGRLKELVGAYEIALADRRRAAPAEVEDLLLRKAQIEAEGLGRPDRAAATLIEVIRANPRDRFALDLLMSALAERIDPALVSEAVGLHVASLDADAQADARRDPTLGRWCR